MATELNPKNFPVLSYVLDRLPSFTSKSSSDVDRSSSASSSKSDPSSSSSHSIEIVTQMPHLAHPNVLASMTNAIAEVAQTRSVLRTLGPRPDRAKLAEIDASLSESFEEIALSPNDNDVAEKEQKRIEAVDQEKTWYNSILKLNELHESYEKLLKEAEERLVRIYESAEKNAAAVAEEEAAEVEVNEEVVCILQQASENPLDRVDLSGRKLKLLPEAFGKIQGLLVLNLYNNQLEAIPDSIAGLQNLLELDVSTNFLETLPDSIGLLSKLKILNVSCNKLTTLPDSICHCGSLVVLDASYNNLTYLPTNIGFELVKLEKLLIHLNKIRSLPTSIGEMRSLRYLDAHFNELNGLPNSFRMLTNLEYLNLSSNFSDLQDLSASFGDLISLQELDLSNNQIHSLPDAFGTLVNLTKLNLDQNPLVVPPEEVVKQGVDAVKMYMGKRWVSMLEEEEKMANLKDEMDHPNHLDSCIGSSLIFQIPLRTCSQGEIGCRSAGDNVLEREGYAVSAGFSLRLVALGRGGDALGSMDSFVNRLLQYLGAKEERSVLAPSHEDHRSAAQITDGSTSNVDITAPGAIIALTLMYLKTESEVIFSKLSIPQTHYDLEISPTCDWIQSQVPEVVKNGISHLRDDMDDMYEVDVEALVQAYVNIVAGACISLGLRFAGTRDGNACALLNNYALNLLNEIKPLSATPGNAFPRGISKYVDRGTLEMCLYLIIISLSVVMAGSGDLQVFRLLRFLRSRNSADGHANYGTQMAVSLATGFLFLGGGMRTFSTNNGSLALLLITLYPRLPSGPNDNRCHLQAFRHLYVLATEARWLQTIDVESGLPVYAPLEVTLKETKLYSETRFCEITPCILPERAILKRICVCGPRYWPQQIELVPEEKNWWSFGDKSDPFNSGVIYVKRKVGACSYVDDPVGCQSLLSRAMHKVFGLRTLGESNMLANSHRELDSDSVDHLVSTFSSDPSLIAFAQLCCDKSWNNRSDSDFKEFCLQVVFDCISKDRPALLQVYLSLYTTIGSMVDLLVKSDTNVCDSLSITSLKVALAYNEAVSSGRLASSGGFVQPIFLASLRKRCEEILNCSTELKINLMNYLIREAWPDDYNSKLQKDIIILPWYLKWFSVPSPSIIKAAVEKIKSKSKNSTSAIPLLRLLLPSTHINAISEIDRVFFSSNETTVL